MIYMCFQFLLASLILFYKALKSCSEDKSDLLRQIAMGMPYKVCYLFNLSI